MLDAGFPVTEERRGVLVARGVCRLLREMGYGTLTEFSLRTGRRLDAVAVGGNGHVIGVEVKTSVADFRADGKWPEYRDFCDAFFFAVPPDFPQEILPEDCGLIVADGYGAAILRPAPVHPVNGSRRKTLLLRFALMASGRLQCLLDPEGR